jgi:2,3-bisphosphoglycerate-independent phosphoglycerate mutase
MSGLGAAPGLPVSRVCLVVLDGWGLADPGPGNAVELAATPVFDELWSTFPHTTLTTCGRAVGLPEGQMGNSEVGHLNLGAGSVVRQDLVRIDEDVESGRLGENAALRRALDGARRVHLIGLVSDGGVHSSIEHLRALVEVAREQGTEEVVIHAFTDGRDTLPHSGAGFLAELDGLTGARVASVVGRYWAMDRDRRWDRTQRAYDLLMRAQAPHHAQSGEQAVRDAYERGETDEFIEPTIVGEPAPIDPSESVIAFNFRPDRMRQLVRALAEPGFGEGEEADADAERDLPGWSGRGAVAPLVRLATMTEYEEGWPYPVLYAPERPATTLASVLAGAGSKQLHVAETEKYPHVTYFFNGGEEERLAGEERELVPSPRDVPTYDHKPQMSAPEVASAFVDAWTGHEPVFGIINFANADMVGHTGVIPAAVAAVETVDACLGEVVRAVHAGGGACVVTADHGNAEVMLEPDGSPNTAHSLSPVPLIVTVAGVHLREGVLADVAPTVLSLLGMPQPTEMSGTTLLVES